MQSPRQFIPRSTLSAWNLMIQTSLRNGLFSESLNLYSSMLKAGVKGDNYTFPSIAKACAKVNSIWDGRKIHAHSILLGFQDDIFVQTGLMDMYSKCSDMVESRKLFDEMPVKGLVAWNSMISAYSKASRVEKSFELLRKMLLLGQKPNQSTFVGLLSGCTRSTWVLCQGLSIHSYVIKLGFILDLFLSNSVVSMYVRYGLLDDALSVFNLIEEKSTISWTAITSGYLRMGDYIKALHIFNQMHRQRVKLDTVSFVNLVSALALSGSLLEACSAHALIIKSGCDHKHPISNSLINLYGKCSDLNSAQKVFDSMHEKNVLSWTSMIGGYVNNGCTGKALSMFQKLLNTTIETNEVTLTTILLACADFGSLSLGEKVEEYIKANQLESNLRVRTSLIHMYCKCGSLERAKRIFCLASTKDVALWSSMIGGYAMYGMGKEALSLFKEMQGQENIKPDAIVFTCILSACSHSGLVEEGLKLFDSMQKDFGIDPNIEHYLCLVDLLSRAGHLHLALEVIRQAPAQARWQLWAPLLSASRNNPNTFLNEFVFEQLFDLKPESTGDYLLLSHGYASLGKWKEAMEIRRMMDERGLVKDPAWSKIEPNSSIHAS